MRQSDVRDDMVKGAVRLLATRGVEGTTFSEVLALTGAPRGSIYHHFPGGKGELVHAALELVSTRGLAAMESVRGEPASAVVAKFLELWRQLLDATQLGGGCAVVAVTVADSDETLLEQAGAIFEEWTSQLTSLLVAGGLSEFSAYEVAVLTICATEGAVALCRAQRSIEPFETVARSLLSMAAAS